MGGARVRVDVSAIAAHAARRDQAVVVLPPADGDAPGRASRRVHAQRIAIARATAAVPAANPCASAPSQRTEGAVSPGAPGAGASGCARGTRSIAHGGTWPTIASSTMRDGRCASISVTPSLVMRCVSPGPSTKSRGEAFLGRPHRADRRAQDQAAPADHADGLARAERHRLQPGALRRGGAARAVVGRVLAAGAKAAIVVGQRGHDGSPWKSCVAWPRGAGRAGTARSALRRGSARAPRRCARAGPRVVIEVRSSANRGSVTPGDDVLLAVGVEARRGDRVAPRRPCERASGGRRRSSRRRPRPAPAGCRRPRRPARSGRRPRRRARRRVSVASSFRPLELVDDRVLRLLLPVVEEHVLEQRRQRRHRGRCSRGSAPA